MDRDDVGACFSKRLNILLRLDDHEMNIDDFFSRGPNRSHDRRPDRDIGNEPAVHDVYVDPVRPSSIDRLDFGCQTSKIC